MYKYKNDRYSDISEFEENRFNIKLSNLDNIKVTKQKIFDGKELNQIVLICSLKLYEKRFKIVFNQIINKKTGLLKKGFIIKEQK